MGSPDRTGAERAGSLDVEGKRIEYRVRSSRTARKLRVRVGPAGVEVVQPAGRADGDVGAFVQEHRGWIAAQMRRVERYRGVRRPERVESREILLRGVPTPVRIEHHPFRGGANRVVHEGDVLVILRSASPTTPAQSLENWLRQQARADIEACLANILPRVGRQAGKVYVMGQRTKWGNCSRSGNLSFNWRLVMAPPLVLCYLVTHEATHLAVPDHSARFWLTVQSLCPESERARQWLVTNGHRLQIALTEPCQPCAYMPLDDLEGSRSPSR
jgi:predicted metal-dependent hydrolase